VPFLPIPTHGLYMGDYIGITALNNVVWPCWNDNRTGIHQAYTAKIYLGGEPPGGCDLAAQMDMNKDGILNAADVALLQDCVFKGEGKNCDSTITAADIVILMNFVFLDMPLPC